MKKNDSMIGLTRFGCIAAVLALSACASPEQAPATADVAVSRRYRVLDGMARHREKMVRANQALAARDYKLARELAIQAQADAKLAQSKAVSSKATATSTQLNEDLRVLREEVDRANSQ